MNHKYQIIKLTRTEYSPAVSPIVSGPAVYSIPDNTFPIKDFNNIQAFRFYSPNNVQMDSSKINLIEINEFKISDYEIVGERTPYSLFSVGTSIKQSERFTEVNIPNNLQQIKCTMFAKRGAVSDIYLILKLNNVKPNEHFKGYYRYETKVFELINSPAEKIKKFSFRPKTGAVALKGISVNFINHNASFFTGHPATSVPYTGIPVVPAGPVGKLSLQLNNLKSNPVLINCKDYTFENVVRKVQFLELDEPILGSADMEGYFLNSPYLSPGLPSFTMYLTHKYSITK